MGDPLQMIAGMFAKKAAQKLAEVVVEKVAARVEKAKEAKPAKAQRKARS